MQVQEKAFELGYRWNFAVAGDKDVLTSLGVEWIILFSNSTMQWRRNNQIGFESTASIPEISYQDFLRLGEIDVSNCKIRIPSGNIIFDLREKLESLGVKGYGNSPAIRTYGYPYHSDLHGSSRPMFMYVRDGLSSMIGTEEYFNYRPEKELTVAQIMQLQPTINNTTTEQIMSEITLKCIQEPQKAKNITADRDYTGILTNSEDTQVDTLGEAKFFRCVNNNGIEAKYKLSLFAPITPPAPPRPAKITQEQFIPNINVGVGFVRSTFNSNSVNVLSFGYSDLDYDPVSCSCGIKSVEGLDSLYERIMEDLEDDYLSNMISDYNRTTFAYALFKEIVNAKINSIGLALCLFSTVEDSEVVCELMDEITEENGGVSSNFFLNPNSGNNIKAWLIPRL